MAKCRLCYGTGKLLSMRYVRMEGGVHGGDVVEEPCTECGGSGEIGPSMELLENHLSGDTKVVLVGADETRILLGMTDDARAARLWAEDFAAKNGIPKDRIFHESGGEGQ